VTSSVAVHSGGYGWSRYSETERDFTATLGDAGAAGLRQALRTVPSENGHARAGAWTSLHQEAPVTHPYSVLPHGHHTSQEIPINDLGPES
jgi:hypothetical protein